MFGLRAARWLTVAAVAAAPLGLVGATNTAEAAGGGGCTPFSNAGFGITIKACIKKTSGQLQSYPSAVNFKPAVNVTCQAVVRIRDVQPGNTRKVQVQDCTLQQTLGTTLVLNNLLKGCTTTGHRYVTDVWVVWHRVNGSVTKSVTITSPKYTC